MSTLDKDDLSPDDYVLGFHCDDNIKEDRTKTQHIRYCQHQTDKHLLSIAPTRTGKGRGLILPNLLHLTSHSVFVIDPKGENALVSARYRKKEEHDIVIFNPYKIYEEEFTLREFTQFHSFNPLKNLDPTSDSFTDDIALIAEALVYDDNGGSGDSHWVNAARGLIEFLITYLITQPEDKDGKKEEATLRHLRDILSGGYPALKTVLDKAKDNTNPLVYGNVGRYSIETSEVHSVIATAETQTRILKSKSIYSALDGEAFDFEQMKHKKMSVYLILPSERLVTQARYLRLVLLVAMSHFMRSEKGKHQVLMILDEFANLGKLNIIEHGYGLIAGHGVTLWSFVQNLTQLQNLYPKNWETFIANSSVVTVSNVNDVTTAEYFSRRAGKEEVDKITGENVTFNVNGRDRKHTNTFSKRVWEDSLPVSDIYGEKNDVIIDKDNPRYYYYNKMCRYKVLPSTLLLFLEGRAKPILCQKFQYDINYPFKERADPNPMHREKSSEE